MIQIINGWALLIIIHSLNKTISYESADIKIRHFMFNKMLDDTNLVWNIFKYLDDVPDMSTMTLALFDNVTLPSGEILYKIEEDWFKYDTYVLGQKYFELAKKVDCICGLNKRGKLYLMLMNMKDHLHSYLYSVCYHGLSSANEELLELYGMRDIYGDEPFPLSNEGRLFFHNDGNYCDNLYDWNLFETYIS